MVDRGLAGGGNAMLVAETLSPRQLAPPVVVGGVHLHQASNPLQNKLRLGDSHSVQSG